ncbi:Alpha/Beta hydrolase protein [Chlamydoabsidia padenii]|nr:Alpha/Beta hydrolase protein [Chlamydoabsidia padenii]
MIVVKPSSNAFLYVTISTALAIALYVCPNRRRLTAKFSKDAQRDYEQHLLDEEDESELLTNNTDYVTINNHELRVIDIPHPNQQAPLIVFIHGLGGQAAQWEHQLEHYSKTYHVLAMDLVGCGYSEVVSEWAPYTTTSLADDIIQLIISDRYSGSKPLILVGHSYGCTLTMLVATSSLIKQGRLLGVVLISPKADLDETQTKGQKLLPWIPDFMVENARKKDRRGGLYSNSVERLLGTHATDDHRKRQLRWNLMSRTDVYKRIAFGASFPSSDVYDKLALTNILLIGGQEDTITPPGDMDIIHGRLQKTKTLDKDQQARLLGPPHVIPGVGHMSLVTKSDIVNSLIDAFFVQLE